MTPHPSSPLFNHRIHVDELASLAKELQSSTLTLEKVQFLDLKRLKLCFSKMSLIIDWHPQFAHCLLIQEPSKSFLSPVPPKVKSEDPWENKVAQWQKRLEHLKLQKAWASNQGSLHLQFKTLDATSCELVIKLHARTPDLYWLEEGLEDSFLSTSCRASHELTELKNPIPYDYTLAYERWEKLDTLYRKNQQLQAIEKHYKPQLQALEKKIEKITSKLDTLESEEELIHQGQLLQANRHLYQNQMRSIDLYDWKIEAMRTLQLTDEPIQEQIKNLFHRAKGVRSHEKQLKQQLHVLNTKRQTYEKAYTHDLTTGVLSAQITPKINPSNRPQELKARPYRLFCYQGAKIYVGKKAQDNLIVSFHIAHGNDLWLHVAGYPGSHVVVKAPEITPQVLKSASLLAHHYSQARKCKSVEVTYTQAKWIKKLPGSKTGTVGVLQAKHYLSHYDELLLKELLESQKIGD